MDFQALLRFESFHVLGHQMVIGCFWFGSVTIVTANFSEVHNESAQLALEFSTSFGIQSS